MLWEPGERNPRRPDWAELADTSRLVEINGILKVQLADVIEPVLDHYGHSENDLAIRGDILADTRHAVVSRG